MYICAVCTRTLRRLIYAVHALQIILWTIPFLNKPVNAVGYLVYESSSMTLVKFGRPLLSSPQSLFGLPAATPSSAPQRQLRTTAEERPGTQRQSPAGQVWLSACVIRGYCA